MHQLSQITVLTKAIRQLMLISIISSSSTSIAATGPEWHDAPLSECFKAIENGKYMTHGKTKVTLSIPGEEFYSSKKLQEKYRNKSVRQGCGVALTNYFYKGREYSLNRALYSYKIKNQDWGCKELAKKNYAFCEYTDHKKLKRVKPTY